METPSQVQEQANICHVVHEASTIDPRKQAKVGELLGPCLEAIRDLSKALKMPVLRQMASSFARWARATEDLKEARQGTAELLPGPERS